MASAFDHKFVSGRILGSDLKKFTDEMPVHERKSDLHWAQVIEVWEDLFQLNQGSPWANQLEGRSVSKKTLLTLRYRKWLVVSCGVFQTICSSAHFLLLPLIDWPDLGTGGNSSSRITLYPREAAQRLWKLQQKEVIDDVASRQLFCQGSRSRFTIVFVGRHQQTKWKHLVQHGNIMDMCFHAQNFKGK